MHTLIMIQGKYTTNKGNNIMFGPKAAKQVHNNNLFQIFIANARKAALSIPPSYFVNY